MSEILPGDRFQADEAEETSSVAVSGDQGELQENVEGINSIEEEDSKSRELKFKELNDKFELERNARDEEHKARVEEQKSRLAAENRRLAEREEEYRRRREEDDRKRKEIENQFSMQNRSIRNSCTTDILKASQTMEAKTKLQMEKLATARWSEDYTACHNQKQ